MVKQLKKTKSSLKQLVIPGMFFEDMGITYLGPVDGHNVEAMLRVFREAKRCKNEEAFVPNGNTVLNPGDRAIIIVQMKHSKNVLKYFQKD